MTRASSSHRLEPLRHVDAGVLDVAYYEAGPADGPAVMLLHGFPYDIHSYVDVAPILAAQGCRVIVPYLRGFGVTRFRDAAQSSCGSSSRRSGISTTPPSSAARRRTTTPIMSTS